jgi:hypothetical protein
LAGIVSVRVNFLAVRSARSPGASVHASTGWKSARPKTARLSASVRKAERSMGKPLKMRSAPPVVRESDQNAPAYQRSLT